MQGAERRRLVRLASAINTKARRLGARGRISPEDLARIQLQQDQCEYCGVKLEIGQGSFDHRIAYDRGGQNILSNVTRCCFTCQREKFTKSVSEYDEYKTLTSKCVVCGKEFKPRWGEWKRGRARTCSHQCAAKLRWR
jgi:HNH endonuclease